MILDDILNHKRQELTARRAERDLAAVQRAAEQAEPTRGFRASLIRPGLSVISEVKRRSPAKGVLRPTASAGDMAETYARAGARAISVLTDERFFHGSDADLIEARQRVAVPLLRKDFVIDDYQVWEARAIGADAILLIVKALSRRELTRLHNLARELGLDALVEVHDEQEVAAAVEIGADLIGINNRDLTTMTVDLGTTLRLRPRIPTGVAVVSESGIRTPEDLEPILACGVDAILVGEALMTSDDPGAALRSLLQAGATA